MNKILLSACAAFLLLVGCVHHENRTFILDNPRVSIAESYTITDLTLPAYLCSTDMKYTTEDGELHTIKGYKWAMPLDRLLRATANDTLRNLPKSTLNAKHAFQFNRVCLTKNGTFLFTGELTIQDDANPRKAQAIPFRYEVKVKLPMDAVQYRNAVIQVLGEILQKEI